CAVAVTTRTCVPCRPWFPILVDPFKVETHVVFSAFSRRSWDRTARRCGSANSSSHAISPHSIHTAFLSELSGESDARYLPRPCMQPSYFVCLCFMHGVD
uniref:Uncharacterized protein n=1 Tax=Aegilops tauschii subsp. strangulata TaxID=200361 RepID=A0A453PSX4_AEGTS